MTAAHTPKQSLLSLDNYLTEKVKPHAHLLDKDAQKLRDVFKQLIEIGLLKILIPKEYGGLNFDSTQYANLSINIAKCSGALSLLQAQHQRAVSYIKVLNLQSLYPSILKDQVSYAYYNALKHHEILHVTIDEETPGSVRLSGTLPWVTGLDLLDQLFLLFRSANHQYVTLLPFKNVIQNGGEISCSEPINTRVLSSANNVSVTLTNWLIRSEDIISKRGIDEEHFPEALPSPPFVFVAYAEVAFDYIRSSRYFNRAPVQKHFNLLQGKFNSYKEKILLGGNGDSLTLLRQEGFPIARDALELAILACGAKVLLEDHPVGRMVLEMWQPTITGPREEQLDAYLEKR